MEMKISILCVIALLATSISTAKVPDDSTYSNGDAIPVIAIQSLLRKPLGEHTYGYGDVEQGDVESSSIIDDSQEKEEDDDVIPSSIKTDDPEKAIMEITASGEPLESSEGRAGRKARGLRKRVKKTLKKLKKKLQRVAQRLPPIGVNVKLPL
ncbi:hypothetical protein J437_LFUL010543 [Ladona fulva]|uniref:Uncharacterized protein n=1 Tax=Ladona fulva TaxID=123851 RepID=A0A8K0K4G4_LADFU|nr:hypothetical protein J437_LFUL010543 [Ladona fulva]